jgi:hypothetical protein
VGSGQSNEALLVEWQAQQGRLDTLHTFRQTQAGDLELFPSFHGMHACSLNGSE